jgi:hypothetical protein
MDVACPEWAWLVRAAGTMGARDGEPDARIGHQQQRQQRQRNDQGYTPCVQVVVGVLAAIAFGWGTGESAAACASGLSRVRAHLQPRRRA